MRIILLIPALVLILVACSTNSEQQKDKPADKLNEISVDSFDSGLPEQEYITEPDKKRIVSATDTLYKGDTLKIQFKTPHPRDFAIISPDDDFFFVVNSNNDTHMPSLMDPDKFENIDLLEIVTDKTKVSPYDTRINHNTIIFTKTGKYQLRLSEVLCTDDGTPLEMDSVYYIDNPRIK
jgi:hypothetical protein